MHDLADLLTKPTAAEIASETQVVLNLMHSADFRTLTRLLVHHYGTPFAPSFRPNRETIQLAWEDGRREVVRFILDIVAKSQQPTITLPNDEQNITPVES